MNCSRSWTAVGENAVPGGRRQHRLPGRRLHDKVSGALPLHLADWKASDKKQAPIGKGDVDWKKLFAAAKKGGVKNYYVEMDLDAMRASIDYLKNLKA